MLHTIIVLATTGNNILEYIKLHAPCVAPSMHTKFSTPALSDRVRILSTRVSYGAVLEYLGMVNSTH